MISLEKWKILTPLQNLPSNVRILAKLIYAKGFKKLPKVQKFAKSGHTDGYGCEHNRIETQVVEVGDKKFDHYDLSCNPNIFVYTNFYTIVEIVGRLRQGSNSFEK